MTLLSARETSFSAADFVSGAGQVFARFDERTQDSGNISYGVDVAGRRFFVKTAGNPARADDGTTRATRVELLRNAARLSHAVSHDVLPTLHNIIEASDGPVLVYDWVDGQLIDTPAHLRSDPRSAFCRFRQLPVAEILNALDATIDLHHRLVAAGWIAVDFYDGSLIYDFGRAALHVIDLDMYNHGPFINQMGRMYGSTRYMAPEEFELGAPIDERTTVFMLGRAVQQLLSGCNSEFRGTQALRAVSERSCQTDRNQRYDSVAHFRAEWLAARLTDC